MYKQPVEMVLQFLRDEFGSQFKAYYDGDPDQIPDFNLPAVSVVKLSDQIDNGPTGMKQVTEQIQIKLIFNKADDWSAIDETTDLTEKRIRDIVEARDPQTGGWASNTLKYALVGRFPQSQMTLDDSMQFQLGAVVRPADLVTEEGHVTLTLTYLVPNVSRLD